MDSLKIDKRGISEQVTEHIKKMIRDGKYEEGQKILGEREMALELKVSRNTVREAYKILEAYGYLTVKQGTGFFVATEAEQISKMTSSFFVKTDQILNLFAVRKILENSTVQWVVENYSEKKVNKLSAIVEEAKKLITNTEIDFTQLGKLDHEFHMTLADFSENSVLVRIMHNLIDLLEGARKQSIQIPGRAIQSVKEHGDIVKAIKEKNIEIAQKLMLSHLESVEKAIINETEQKD